MKYDLRKMSDEHLWDLLQILTIHGCTRREYEKVHDEIMRRWKGNSLTK